MRFHKVVFLFLMCATIAVAGVAQAQTPAPQKSRMSTPFRPANVPPAYALPTKAQVTVPDVPFYIWRHGCGPTAVGMVVGFWDGKNSGSLGDLVAGDASVETAAVRQVIASGGDFVFPSTDLPWAAGNEHHYEDYCRPVDMAEPMLTDSYITAGRTAHADDCIADYMLTSRSTEENFYGWSSSLQIAPAFTNYVASISSNLVPTSTAYYIGYTPELTIDIVKAEIDSGRPMVFLVDSDGDAATDHFVTVVGYDDTGHYIFHDTWDTNEHSAIFQPMSTGQTYGVWGGWSFNVADNTPTGIQLSQTGAGGWFSAGDRLELSVTATNTVGDPSYQWEKATTENVFADVADETSDTFVVESLATGDTGWYRCRVTDEGAKSVAYSTPVHVEVFDSIPVAGIAALIASGLALSAIGARRIRRK